MIFLRKYSLRLLVLGLGLAALLAVSFALVRADNSPNYTISRWTIVGGGSLQSGSYTLTGTTGQVEAGPLLQSRSYTLQGGFWQPEGGYTVFVPRLTK